MTLFRYGILLLSTLCAVGSKSWIQECSHTSCVNQCQLNTAHGIQDKNPFQCKCDPECLLFEDCCKDGDKYCGTLWEESKNTTKNGTLINQFFPFATCERIQTATKYAYIWLISTCPTEYTDIEVKARCENTARHPNSKIPVTILSNNLTFQNAYCAICHQMNPLMLRSVFWKAEIVCHTSHIKSFSHLMDVYANSNCHVKVEVHQSVKLRHCVTQMVIKNCTQIDGSDHNVKQCLLYKEKINAWYQHPNRAIYSTTRSNMSEFNALINDRMPVTLEKNAIIYFRFDPTGMSFSRSGQILVPIQRSCERIDYVYDNTLDICMQLFCPKGFLPFNGSCLTREHHPVMNITERNLLSLHRACKRMDGAYESSLNACIQLICPNGLALVNGSCENKSENITLGANSRIVHLNITVSININCSDSFIKWWMVYSKLTCVREILNDGDVRQFEYKSTTASTTMARIRAGKTLIISNCSLPSLINETFEWLAVGVNVSDMIIIEASVNSAKPCEQIQTIITLDKFMSENVTQYMNDVNFQVVLFPRNVSMASFCETRIRPNCTSVGYSPDKYKLLNGSLEILETSEILSSEYIISQNIAYVCRNFSRYYHNTSETFFNKAFTFSCVIISISIVACLLTMTVYLLLPQLRNVPGKIVMSLTTSLCISQILGLVATFASGIFCIVISVLGHFSWLSVFLWKTVMAVDIARTMHISNMVASIKTKMYFYYVAIAWIFPGVVVCMLAFLDNYDYVHLDYGYRQHGVCWILPPNLFLYAIGCPIIASIIINCICLGLTLVSLMPKAGILGKANYINRKHQLVKTVLKLSLLTGSTWSVMFLANYFDKSWIWYLHILLNGSTGLYIFISFVCNTRVLIALKEKFFLNSRSPSIVNSSNIV